MGSLNGTITIDLSALDAVCTVSCLSIDCVNHGSRWSKDTATCELKTIRICDGRCTFYKKINTSSRRSGHEADANENRA